MKKLRFRSDYLFFAKEKLASLFRAARVKKVDIVTSEISLDIMKAPNAVFDSSLILVNKEFPITTDFSKSVVDLDGHLASNICVSSFKELQREVTKRYQKNILVRSAFRTSEEQAKLINKAGLSSDCVAPVGTSEHETGYALDIYVEGFLGGEINLSSAGRYVSSKGYECGFIIRYPYGKKSITGIRYEPWHIRYVGKPHAEIIYKNSLTLEEYILDFYSLGEFYRYGRYIISRQPIAEAVKIPNNATYIEISPDNTGNLFITAEIPI